MIQSMSACGWTSGQGHPVSTTAAVLDPSVHEIISMSDVITAACAELDFTYNVDVQRMNLLGENTVNTRHGLQMCDPAMTHLTANANPMNGIATTVVLKFSSGGVTVSIPSWHATQ